MTKSSHLIVFLIIMFKSKRQTQFKEKSRFYNCRSRHRENKKLQYSSVNHRKESNPLIGSKRIQVFEVHSSNKLNQQNQISIVHAKSKSLNQLNSSRNLMTKENCLLGEKYTLIFSANQNYCHFARGVAKDKLWTSSTSVGTILVDQQGRREGSTFIIIVAN